jgi:flagellar biosynthesis protein FlhA
VPAGEYDLGPTLIAQLLRHRRPAGISAVVLALLALLPGMPHFILLLLAGGAGVLALKKPAAPVDETVDTTEAPASQSEREAMEQLLPIDLLELEIGYELVGLVDETRDGNLLKRISGIRRQFAGELGVIVPPIHVRDNLQLEPGEYRLLLSGNQVGGGKVRVGHYLAMDPGGAAPPIAGEAVKEPAFGLPARWVSVADRANAEALGYTVVDAATVAATHLSELLRRNCHELLGRREVQELLDIFAKSNPNLVDELVPNLLSLGDVIKVLRNLLREGVSIRDLRTILEALADHAVQTKDSVALTELVRERMAKYLTGRVQGRDEHVQALVLEPQLEHDLRCAVRSAGGEGASFDGVAIPRVLGALETTMSRVGALSEVPVLLVSPDIRPHMAAFASRHVPGIAVYSYREIDPQTPIRTLGVVGTE